VYIPPAKRRRLEEEQRRQQQLQQQKEQRVEMESQLSSSIAEATGGADRAAATEPSESANSAARAASLQRQRASWDDQRRAIYGAINRLNTETIKPILADLFSNVNLVRMRGVFAKSLLQASLSNHLYAPVYASCVAVLNSKLPEIGELVVARAILSFRTLYRRKDRTGVTAVCGLLGHLFHQNVVHELLILQILTLLLDGVSVTDDSVEVAATLLSTVGYALLQVSPVGVRAVTERLRSLLHEGELNHRVQYKIEKLLDLRKSGFRNKSCYPPIPEELDLVEADDQITFELSLDDDTLTKQDELDVFRVDPDFEENEATWAKIRAEVLGEGGEDGSDDDDDDAETASGEDDGNNSEDETDKQKEQAMVPAAGATNKAMVVVQDLSDADLVHLRRQIYLTIMSAAGFEETAHKLAKMNIPAGREEELVNMLIECCSQEKTFQRHYGMIAGRFCLLADRWRSAFMDSFVQQYSTIHRLETNKLRNVAKLFAHLLHTDALPWSVLSVIHLNEDETTSSSRIFLKILVQEMTEALGMARLKERFESKDPEKVEWYKEIFPTDNVRKTRYAINFFTSIGLGPLTDGLREFLKNAPKLILQQAQQTALAKKAADDDDGGSESDSSSSSSSSSYSSSSSSSSSCSRSSRSSRSSSSSSSSDSRRGRGRGRGRSRRRESRSESSSSSSSRTSDGSESSSSRSPSPRGRNGQRKRRSRSVSSSSSATSASSREDRRRRERDSKRSGRGRGEKRALDKDRVVGDRQRLRSPSIPNEVVRGEDRPEKTKERAQSRRGRDRNPSASSRSRSRSASPLAPGRDRGGSSERKRRRPSPSPEDS
jgi:pre-mRNA-splicing factor CWC22